MIYFRVETSSGVKLRFLTSKTKLAQMKISGITSLDLSECPLSSQLIEEVVFGCKQYSVLMEYSARLIGIWCCVGLRIRRTFGKSSCGN